MTRTDDHIIVSIDFGTSNSGFAFIESNAPTDAFPDTFVDYEDAPVPGVKCPTAVLYGNGRPIAFGYTALLRANEASTETRILVNNFKRTLHQADDTPPPYDLPNKTAKDITIDFLTMFKAFFVKQIQKQYPLLNFKKIRWCLTVPAIASQQLKWTMREIAVQAGLVEVFSEAKNDVVLVSEPEAAAIYCQRNLARGMNQIYEQETFLVVDAGGGTVDLTMYTVRQGAFVEIVPGTGGWCGGTRFDEIILNKIKGRVGADEWARFKREDKRQYHDIERSIEQQKRSFAVHYAIKIQIPSALKITQRHLRDMRELQDGDVFYFVIKWDEVNRELEALFNETTVLIGRMFDSAEAKQVQCQRALLVGGFSSSSLFQAHIANFVVKRYPRCIVHQPRDPQAAIVLGAALYLRAPDTFFISRCARQTYGVTICRPLTATDPSNDPTIFYHSDERIKYINIFKVYVTVGDEIPVDRIVEHKLYPLYDNQVTMDVAVLMTDKREPQFVTDVAVTEMCALTVPLGDVANGRRRCVFVSFKFGAFDILITAKKQGTNEVVHIATSYDVIRRQATENSAINRVEPLRIETQSENRRRSTDEPPFDPRQRPAVPWFFRCCSAI